MTRHFKTRAAMTMRRTKTETCEECEKQFSTFTNHERGKKGWLCSTECVASRRLKVHGRNCKQCGTRYVEQSIRKRNGGFCALECRNAFMLNNRKKKCQHCEAIFESEKGRRFCGLECYAAFKRNKAIKQCLCCGKITYKRSRRWVKEFCSITCSGKYRKYINDRKARCSGCGKATGISDSVKCEECKLPAVNTWDRVFVQFINQEHRHNLKSWDDKLRGMIQTNLHRESIAKLPQELKLKQKRKTRRRTAWIDKWNEACSEMILLFKREQKRALRRDQWSNKLDNWLTGHKKRMRIKKHLSQLKDCEQS